MSEANNTASKAKPDTKELRFNPKQRKYKFELPKTKFELIKEILKRWWYGMEQWPDPSKDYTEELKAKNLRLVSEAQWNETPIVEHGMEKVKEVAAYPGVFINAKVS